MDTSNSYISTTSGSAGDLFIDSQGSGHDLYLQAADDGFIRPLKVVKMVLKLYGNYGVELYGYNLSTYSWAMNKYHGSYISDLGSGSVRSVADKRIKQLGMEVMDMVQLFQYSTQGAGSNRGGIEMSWWYTKVMVKEYL